MLTGCVQTQMLVLEGVVAALARLAEGRTDVAFSTGLGLSLAAVHLKEEVCVVGGPAVPICSH